MISEEYFRLKKDGEPYSNCLCRHPELIENYDKAVADTTQIWECHHRFEAIFTKQELIKYNWYFNVEPNCLIFLTKAEHSSLHKRRQKRPEGSGVPPKKVLCVETGETFESINDVQRKTGICQGNISNACNGKRNTAGGFHWKYV